jgi:hypothetical protein
MMMTAAERKAPISLVLDATSDRTLRESVLSERCAPPFEEPRSYREFFRPVAISMATSYAVRSA